MKALRRSIKGDKNDSKLQHISVTPKSAVAIVPPKKVPPLHPSPLSQASPSHGQKADRVPPPPQVIRALYDYEAQNGQELSFQKGDFFHVIARENDTDWYEACNPAVPDARGLVPVNFFQALGKTERDSGQSTGSAGSAKAPDHDSGYSDTTPGQAAQQQQQQQQGPNPQRLSKLGKGSGAMVYGIVMYDFAAERPDELEAKAGEAIIVIAQSNPEWFVAKPIGRLGGPGLIPVSFIEIRDMTTGQAVPDSQEAVQRAGVPKVEEWKKMAADYKNSSITLGKFEASNQQQQQQGMEQDMGRMSLQQAQQRQSQQAGNGQSYQSLRQSQQAKSQQQQNQQYAAQQHAAAQHAATSQLFSPVSAHIPRYWFSEDKYWFVIEAALEDGRHWELQRYYEDFYDFQIALLTEFPAEAGNTGTQKRSLPYMPGPVNYVTDQITDGRRHNLDAYVKNLLTQPPYISRCTLVKQFFAPREGDFEIDPDAPDGYRDSAGSQQSSTGTPADDRGEARRISMQGPPGGGFPAQAASREVGQQQSQASLQAAGGAMKVKIYFGDDLFAIRVPAAISYVALHEKIRERLKIPGGEEIAMMWQEGGGRASLESEADLGEALARGGGKLVVFVEYR
ncbi:bud emergence protein 1 [Pseudogymnoascus australis]